MLAQALPTGTSEGHRGHTLRSEMTTRFRMSVQPNRRYLQWFSTSHLRRAASRSVTELTGLGPGYARRTTDQTILAMSTPRDFKQGDVLHCLTSQNQPMWLEMQHIGTEMYATSGGYELCLKRQMTESATFEAELIGPVRLPMELFQKLGASLDKDAIDAVKKILQVKPLNKGSKVLLQEVETLYSYESLWSDVKSDAAQWVEGAGPNGVSGSMDVKLADAVGQAGELLALFQGKRGLVLTQLWTIKDEHVAGAIHNPLAVRAMQQALQDPDIDVRLSLALQPNGNPLGLTAILAASQAPFNAWAAHLCSLGVQSALVADTPYHKIMIGRMLGYSESNIMDHVRSRHNDFDSSILVKVEEDMNKLSDAHPALPWRMRSDDLPDITAQMTNVNISKTPGFGNFASKTNTVNQRGKSGGRRKR